MSPGEVETHRYRCEVRSLLENRTKRGKMWLQGMFLRIEKERGSKSAEKLKAEVLDQWNKGNRGQPNLWL